MDFVDDQTNDRLARIKILGIPLYLRSDENISEIACKFGKVLEVEGHNWHSVDLSSCFATILTNSWKFVNEEVVIIFSGKQFHVSVRECEKKWEPFLDRSFPEAPLSEFSDSENDDAMNEQGDSSGEDSGDEGISETWINRDTMEGLEDGEINMKGSETHEIATGIAIGDRNQLAGMGEISKGRSEREELNAEVNPSEEGAVPTLGRSKSSHSNNGPYDPPSLGKFCSPMDNSQSNSVVHMLHSNSK